VSAHYFNGGGFVGIIHIADIYHYRGFTFEWHHYCGPMKCRKNGDASDAQAGPKFFRAVASWEKLPKSKREKYRVSG
jgi:hypothetical protein